MKKLNWAKKMVALLMLIAVVVTSVPVIEANAMHGTATEIITKKMLKTKPDEDYEINWDMQADASEGLYSEYFLKDSIQTVSIKIDENNFNYLLQNAIDEPSVMTDYVTIHELVTSIENPEMSYERTVTFEATEGELFLTLTVEGGYLKINGVESK